MSSGICSRLLTGVLLGGVVLRVVFAAECASYHTTEECVPIPGCFWNEDHCECASEMSMDVAFVIDSSGSVGETNFGVGLDWVVGIIDSTLPMGARIALIRFETDTEVFMTFTESESYTTEQRQDATLAIPYVVGWTYTNDGIQAAIDLYDSQSASEIAKVIILITDGKPKNDQNHVIDVCPLSQTLKEKNIKVVIIGVGNWNPANVDCLVSSDDDIIFVNEYSAEKLDAILPVISEVTCPVEYKLAITEVKLEADAMGDGSRFVEVFNQGQSARLRDIEVFGIFNGTLAIPSDDTFVPQSKYLVIYDGDLTDIPTCIDCECAQTGNNWCTDALYVECCASGCPCKFAGDNMHNKDWYQRFKDNFNYDLIDEVKYDVSTFPSIVDGYSFALKFTGFDNDVGDNWKQSCFIRGTPGDAPVADCDNACDNEKCKVNGDEDAYCAGGVNGQCLCTASAHYYYSDGTCKLIPMPGPCVATFYRQPKELQYVWEKAATDMTVNYSLSYVSDSGNTKLLTSVRTKTVVDYDYSRGYDVVAGTVKTVIGTAKSEAVECWPVTLPPTTSTTEEYVSTTPEPTVPWEKPHYWISGDVCREERCDCPQDSDWTCDGEDVYKQFPATDAATYVTVKKHQLGPYGEEYPWLVQIFWRLHLIDDEYDYTPPPVNTTTQLPETTEITRRRLLGLLDSTTEEPDTTLETLSEDYFGISPREGSLWFNGSDATEKIELMIPKKLLEDKRRWRLYRLQLTRCDNEGTHGCKLVYPKKLYMIVDINGGETKGDTTSGGGGTPDWLWYVIGALLLIPLFLGFVAYRYWTGAKVSKAVLRETKVDLDAAHEEAELGFGHDLGTGDIKFNPLATGVPGASHAPAMGEGYMDGRKTAAGQEYVHEAVEKFKVQTEIGQTVPDRGEAY